MSADGACPDCGEPLERTCLRGSSAVGSITVLSEEPTSGFLSGLRSEEMVTPVPYVCPACRRTLSYAER